MELHGESDNNTDHRVDGSSEKVMNRDRIHKQSKFIYADKRVYSGASDGSSKPLRGSWSGSVGEHQFVFVR
jgi:hypothetical protein